MSQVASLTDLVSLAGRSAVVTGGSGGIGSAIVQRLHAAGAGILSVDLPGRGAPAGAEAVDLDLADGDAIEGLGTVVDERFDGRLQVVVHAAGITRDAVVWKMEPSAWDDVLRVNLASAYHVLRMAVPRLRAAGGGSIVLVSSINGERGKFGQSNYAASKAGLHGLMKSVAREVGGFGIRVNVVAPGMIETEMTKSVPEKFRQRAVDESALGRIGDPDDVARAVLFLASDLSRHVTGQVLRVDGGQLIA